MSWTPWKDSGGGNNIIPFIEAGEYMHSERNARARNAEYHDWAVEDARVNREWQERMANSAHQREVEDLRKAGLNPILSGTGGAGSATPGGSQASFSGVLNNRQSRIAASAMDAKMNAASVSLMKAQEAAANGAADVAKEQARKTKREADMLGPKSYIFDKLLDGLKAGANEAGSVYKDFKEKYEHRPLPRGGLR